MPIHSPAGAFPPRPPKRGCVAHQPQQRAQREGRKNSTVISNVSALRLALRKQPRSRAAPDSLQRTDNLVMQPAPALKQAGLSIAPAAC